MINIEKNLFLRQADNITVVTSGKGSTGKTWFSLSLAHGLNLLGQRVLILDADNGFLNADFQLNQNNGFYLNDVVDNLCTLNQAVSQLRKKLDVITARAGSDLLENMPIGRLQVLSDDLFCLAQKYDQVILDVSQSSKVLHNLLPQGSNVILLCNSNPSSLVNTYKFLQDEVKTLKADKLQIVVNYANSPEDGRQTYNTLRKACEQYIDYVPKLLGIIRNDTSVREAISKHVLFLSEYAKSPAATDVMNIASNLMNKGDKNATGL